MTYARALGSLLVAVCCTARRRRIGADLSEPADHAGGAVRGRRRDRRDRAHPHRPLSHDLGQQIVIETVGGAGGMIGAARVARAAPDGYTILLHQVGLAAGHDALSQPVVRRREGPHRHRHRQHQRLDHHGAQDAAAEQHGRAGEVDEGAGPERQGGARRGRLVRSSVRRAVRQRGRRDGRSDSLSRRRTGAQRSGRRPRRPELPVGGGRRAAGPRRQPQGLRHRRQEALRRAAGHPDHGRGRLQEHGPRCSGTSCSRRPARRGRSSTG